MTMNQFKVTDKLEGQLLEDVAHFFKALGNETRTQIIWSLRESSKKSSELAESLKMSPSAISHQLTLLKHLKIVTSRRDGKNQIYSLSDEHIDRILTTVVEHYQED